MNIAKPLFTFWLSPNPTDDAPSSDILDFADGVLTLKQQADGRLQLTARLSAGTSVLTTELPIANKWQRISLGVTEQGVYLQVDEEMYQNTTNEALNFTTTSPRLKLGGSGHFSLSTLQMYDASSPTMFTLDADQKFDEQGQAELRLVLNGILLGNSYPSHRQRIDFELNGAPHALLLVDVQDLELYAQQLLSQQSNPECSPLSLVKSMGSTATMLPKAEALRRRQAVVEISPQRSPVAVAKASLNWIAHHPKNRASQSAFSTISNYLESPLHDDFALALNEELDAAITDSATGLDIRMLTLLTGLEVWAEVINDSPEATELLSSNVHSGNDFYTWMRFLSLPGKGWAGDSIPMPKPSALCSAQLPKVNAGTAFAYNPIPCRVNGRVAAGTLLGMTDTDPQLASRMTPLLRTLIAGLRGAPIQLTRLVFEPSSITTTRRGFELISSAHANPVVTRTLSALIKAVIRAGGKEGGQNMLRFMKNQTNVRFDVKTLLLAIAYLESRDPEGSYSCSNGCEKLDKEVYKTVKANLGRFILGVGLANKGNVLAEPDLARRACVLTNQAHGAANELVLTTLYHALYEAGFDQYEILGADIKVRVPYVTRTPGSFSDAAYDYFERQPDLVLAGDDESERYWIETKSWQNSKKNGTTEFNDISSSKSHWTWPNSSSGHTKYGSGHRQFIIDSLASVRTEAISEQWKDLDKGRYDLAPRLDTADSAGHRTWIQVWNQETRKVEYQKKNAKGKWEQKETYITLAPPWINGVTDQGVIPSFGIFPKLQKHLATAPDNFGNAKATHSVDKTKQGFQSHMRSQSVNKLSGTIAPFTLWHGAVTEVGEAASTKMFDSVIAEIFDPETGRWIDPDNLSAQDVAAMQEKVEAQLNDLLGPVGDVLDAIRAVEDAALPEFIKSVLDEIEDAVAESVEGLGGDRIREIIREMPVPLSLGDKVCEADL